MAKLKRDKPLPIMVRLTPKGLRPLAAEDADRLASEPRDREYDLVPRTKRSWPQLKTYWKALGIVVKATGKWPNAEKLSDELKWACGYRTKFMDWDTKTILERPDSIALEAMEHNEFCAFMDAAMEKLADAVGFDPLAFLAEVAA